MNLKPLEDRIVVRPNEAEETTVSGIVIPDTAKEKPQTGEVLAVGPGRRSEQTGTIIPLDVKVGDTVVYSKYGGTEIVVEGEDLLILSGRDVLAIQETKKKKQVPDAQDAEVRRQRPSRPGGGRQQARRRGQGHPRPAPPPRRAREEGPRAGPQPRRP